MDAWHMYIATCGRNYSGVRYYSLTVAVGFYATPADNIELCSIEHISEQRLLCMWRLYAPMTRGSASYASPCLSPDYFYPDCSQQTRLLPGDSGSKVALEVTCSQLAGLYRTVGERAWQRR
eukprot:3659064-Pyramimonas_sp.AAC.2